MSRFSCCGAIPFVKLEKKGLFPCVTPPRSILCDTAVVVLSVSRYARAACWTRAQSPLVIGRTQSVLLLEARLRGPRKPPTRCRFLLSLESLTAQFSQLYTRFHRLSSSRAFIFPPICPHPPASLPLIHLSPDSLLAPATLTPQSHILFVTSRYATNKSPAT